MAVEPTGKPILGGSELKKSRCQSDSNAWSLVIETRSAAHKTMTQSMYLQGSILLEGVLAAGEVSTARAIHCLQVSDYSRASGCYENGA